MMKGGSFQIFSCSISQKLIGKLPFFVGKMCAHVLSHTLDKVRYFRSLLITEDMRPRILIGSDSLLHTLNLAVDDMKGIPVNQLVLLRQYVPPKLVETDTVLYGEPILVYVRKTHDAFANAIMEEYGDCEVIVFERDPMLD